MVMRILILLLSILWLTPAWAYSDTLLDNRAKNAPAFETESELVAFLTQDLTDEKSKARVLAAWMVYQMERDGYRRKELIKYSRQNRSAPEPIPNDPFKTRIGTSQDFANLFADLCRTAGLETQVISGYAGENIQTFRYQKPLFQAAEVFLNYWTGENYPLQRYQAAWNAVKIDDQWELIDTYWMIANQNLFTAKNISSNTAMKRLLEKRTQRLPSRQQLSVGKHINNNYFCAKPIFFIKTHFPLDSRWQLLPTPWTWSTFTSQ